MANEAIKKVTIPNSDLPGITGTLQIINATVNSGDLKTVIYETAINHNLLPGTGVDVFNMRPLSLNTNGTKNITEIIDETHFAILFSEDKIAGSYDIKAYVTVPYSSKYFVRYRVITENQNQVSMWSPIYVVDNIYQTETYTSVSGAAEGGVE